MSKYNEGYLYNGDIYKVEDGNKILFKKGVPILYNEELDTFYLFNSSANRCLFSLLIDENKLSEKEILEYKKTFLVGNYPYKKEGEDGEVFIEEDSIKLDKIELDKMRKKNSNR
ncbi:MAG: hypothetical protein ACI4VL_02170 [Bacilli bacterium]